MMQGLLYHIVDAVKVNPTANFGDDRGNDCTDDDG